MSVGVQLKGQKMFTHILVQTVLQVYMYTHTHTHTHAPSGLRWNHAVCLRISAKDTLDQLKNFSQNSTTHQSQEFRLTLQEVNIQCFHPKDDILSNDVNFAP